ncbi:MAG: ABC transporter substrate-binding protein [Eubacteriales bacterium]|nr:ABC transporter substrate-binding protein [Eubacteriales bacterium]
MKKAISFLLTLSLGIGTFGSMGAFAAEEGYPVTIENNGTTITYEAAPERVVVLSYEVAEVMAALGLSDKVVALAPCMNRIDEALEEYQEVISEMPLFEESGMTNGVPNLETVLSVEPDFVYGSFYSFFSVNCGAAEDYLANEIGIYAADSTWAEEKSLENLYQEISNIGKIFGVEERAQEVIEELRAREAAVTAAVEGLESVPVFVLDYDNGDGTFTSVGNKAYAHALVALAGGENIFGDVEESYVTVSPEEIIARNPQAVLTISYYTEDDGQNKIDTMMNSEDFQEVDAVTEENFLALGGLAFGASAGMQSLDALEAIAEFLHPEAF